MKLTTEANRSAAVFAMQNDITQMAGQLASPRLKKRCSMALRGTAYQMLPGLQGVYDGLTHEASVLTREVWTKSDEYLYGVLVGLELNQGGTKAEDLRRLQDGLGALLKAVKAADVNALEARYA